MVISPVKLNETNKERVSNVKRIPHLLSRPTIVLFFKAIESLTRKLDDMERNKQSQEFHIQTLQGNAKSRLDMSIVRSTNSRYITTTCLPAEVDRLREDLRRRRCEKEDIPGVEREISDVGAAAFPQTRCVKSLHPRELVRNLFILPSYHSWSSKVCRAELEHLCKEVDQLKTRLSESH